MEHDIACIKKHISNPLVFNYELLDQIEVYIKKEMNYSELISDFDNENSAKFLICFRKDWSITNREIPMGERHFELGIHVSARGPLITSRGIEYQKIRWEGLIGQIEEKWGFTDSVIAEKKAKEIALAVAQKFDLTYLEREFLEKITLEDEEVPDDGVGFLELDEPDALKVLFATFL